MVIEQPPLPTMAELAVRNRALASRVRAARRSGKDWPGAGAEDLAAPDGRVDCPFLARGLFPHHCRAPFSPMHWHLLESGAGVYLGQGGGRGFGGGRGGRLAVAAPRGHAKSTLASLILPLLALGLSRQRYIVLMSATVRQAAARLRNLRSELETNRALLAAFPGLARRGRPWSSRALLVDDCLVESYGALSEVRGLNHQGRRPSLVILDDTDATARVRNPLQREALLAWFDEVVEPLGDRDSAIVAVGTILHPDSLLSTLLRRPSWQGTLWRALPEFPRNGHLWTQWMNLLTEPGCAQAERLAAEFFSQNRRAMLEGGRALWPQRDSIADLHHMIAVQGLAAFRKEKQNDPLPPAEGPWTPSRWRRFVVRRDEVAHLAPPAETAAADGAGRPETTPAPPLPLRHLAVYGYLDPATGRGAARRSGDYAALATVGRTPGSDPRFYLLDVWMARAPVEAQVAAVAQAAVRWGWLGFAYEANGFQSVLGPELARALATAAAAAGCPPLVPQAVIHTQPKDLRIERAGLLVGSGRLLFHAHLPPEFIQQAADYPHPQAHDDGLDALAGAVELARRRGGPADGPSIRTVARGL